MTQNKKNKNKSEPVNKELSSQEAEGNNKNADNKDKECCKCDEDQNQNDIDLKDLLAKKEEEANQLLDRMQRIAAEYDNYRKRTQKEKDKIYDYAVVDVVGKFIPVIDNLERAVKASEEICESKESKGLKEGIALVIKQINDILDDLNVKPIDAVDKNFNPELHDAVMHISDESLENNIVVEEFQKGYIYKDEIVIRHSMVKVAN
jgi:molecular chaperone GrpE